ncbi:hypothetical protein HU200_056112 [Digitaria exilis]|uniref:F-box domain-containing protein n=1 Tax=Digitaria exilis TaxID=1010633 RepID=A0A835E143_9POAL|nr:hypothetical protein HU200_056112 [Digitaria exilis]CAB3480270.1 unnamed protein product [Digitaria exilis]
MDKMETRGDAKPAPEPAQARNWSELPRDAIASVFAKLGAVEILMGAGLVCHSWLDAAMVPYLWRSIDMASPNTVVVKEKCGSGHEDVLRAMAKKAVDRSAGQLEVFIGEYFVDVALFKYIGENTRDAFSALSHFPPPSPNPLPPSRPQPTTMPSSSASRRRRGQCPAPPVPHPEAFERVAAPAIAPQLPPPASFARKLAPTAPDAAAVERARVPVAAPLLPTPAAFARGFGTAAPGNPPPVEARARSPPPPPTSSSSSTRRRRRNRWRKASKGQGMRDWAALPREVLAGVLRKLDHIEILMGPGQACRSWRSAARDDPALWRRINMRGHADLFYQLNLHGMAQAAVRRAKGQCEAFWGEYAGDDAFLLFLAEHEDDSDGSYMGSDVYYELDTELDDDDDDDMDEDDEEARMILMAFLPIPPNPSHSPIAMAPSSSASHRRRRNQPAPPSEAVERAAEPSTVPWLPPPAAFSRKLIPAAPPDAAAAVERARPGPVGAPWLPPPAAFARRLHPTPRRAPPDPSPPEPQLPPPFSGLRRRRNRGCEAEAEGQGARCWAALPQDALGAVLWKLDHVEVLMGPGQVCRSWRRAARDDPALWRRIDMRGHADLHRRVDLCAMGRVAIRRAKGQCEAFWAEYAADDAVLRLLGEQ